MSKSKLLKEAIADAKAVRSTALLNAKAALEEAFTPKLQSMISAKMMQEMDDEEMEGEEDEMDAEMDAEVYDEMDDSESLEGEEEMEDEIEAEDDMDVDAEDEVEMDAEMDMDDEEDLELESWDESYHDEDLELEAIIKELEDEDMDSEVEMEDEMEEGMYSEEDHMDEELESSNIENDDDLTEDADIDINEIIAALREDDSFMGDGTPDGDADVESEKEEEMHETVELQTELEEAYKTIKVMKESLNETNLLNAKLLFSNKLFKSYDLNESQKLNVIDNFDRAQSLREVKLVYTTLAESMKRPAKRKVNENASRVTGTTAPKKQIISESNKFSNRMQKLAGLKK